MSWIEDTVTFRGAIRRSGNSLVITIPAELSQRFLLQEGQELVIYGLSRRDSEFEGALQVYLGCFVLHEKTPTVIFKVRVPEERLKQLQEIMREVEGKHLPSAVNLKKLGEDLIEIELLFGAIAPNTIRRVRKVEEVNSIATEIEFKLASNGFDVIDKVVTERVVELRNIDPAMLLKASYKVSEAVRWRWEI